MEQTLVVVKPDGVARGLTGQIISRLEKVGLKLVAGKLIQATKELAEKHYPAERGELWEGIGQKTLKNYQSLGVDPQALLGTADPKEIGKMVRVWLLEYIASGPVFAAVIEGPHAVELVRKLAGNTLPFLSAPGTIRGDLSFDSAYLANTAKRAIKNLLHASGTLDEAKYEVPLWFTPEELVKYERTDEKAMR
ncbi:nucleoside-diphosphate kinase [Candidatus Roizmanbacteria bacterium RIFCSPHIGHO2_12_FULL_41_11]|uniref:nucleoside-diphosphate kinase n=2 Tax=Candidatus Roizmaniibacteriota TaxID=1752723 RepID=A0A1F7J983_9BACT|nr:MAG: nucleoside-diphosphate kinase [Candidatus Roizmanbacteria bacterium RIFCSPHIGHO2_12_FULL_41_11]OGK52167.1 MAG: nucleoside-diphosphate kinase [Candidatus Roizmanbacteria bacterium RIFCSPLOWO2_01_FULL_41_22]